MAAFYLLGPDLISRTIIGFVAPRKSAPTKRGEEITRALVWAVVPLALAILWVWHNSTLTRWGSTSAVDTVYACLGNSCTGADRTNLWPSLRAVLGMNYSILWREYLLVVVAAASVCMLIVNFGRMRRHLDSPLLREVLAVLITPLVADWHVWLSDMLLPEEDLTLVSDVLTRNGTLYQGTVGKKVLGGDGSLQTLTLVSPRRFLRDDYKAAGSPAKRDGYWRPIPGSIFIVLGSDIVNLNIFYVRRVVEPPAGDPTLEENDQIRRIQARLRTGVGPAPRRQ